MSVGFLVPPDPPGAGLVAGLANLPTLPRTDRKYRVGSFTNPAPNLPTLLPTLPYILWSTSATNTRDRKRFTSRNARGPYRSQGWQNCQPCQPCYQPCQGSTP